MAQTSISKTLTKGFAGQLADINDIEVVSRTLDDTAVPFGVAVSSDGATVDDSVELPDAAELLLGIIVHSHEYAKGPGGTLNDAGLLLAGARINVLRRGLIYLVLEQDCVFGDRMYVRITTNGAGKLQLGAVIGATDDSGKTIDARGQIVAMETATAGNPVLCSVDFTNKP